MRILGLSACLCQFLFGTPALCLIAKSFRSRTLSLHCYPPISTSHSQALIHPLHSPALISRIAPDSSHSKELVNPLNDAARQMRGRVRVLALDSTVHANEGAFSLHEIEARVGQSERE